MSFARGLVPSLLECEWLSLSWRQSSSTDCILLDAKHTVGLLL